MSKLKKKMFRDIKLNKSQFIAIFLMVFLGVLVYGGVRSYMDGMINTAEVFYRENNLEDLNVVGNNFSKDDLEKIKNIENVNDAERKLTITGTMEYKEDRFLQLNFIEENKISKFYVMDGEGFDVNKSGVWLDNFYAQNNDLKVGDTIKIKYDGETLEEKIVGLINVPDHVYDVKDESELFPNHENYGFAYMSINEFPEHYVKKTVMEKMNVTDEAIFDMYVKDFNYKDYLIFNYIMVDVNGEENKDSVKANIENNVESALAVSDIKDSASYSVYQGEIEEGETYVGIFSGFFLLIAILSVITTMTRVVKKQRIQIGTLKALGFKKRKITMHYVGYGFWISLFSAIAGLIAAPLLIGNIFIGMEMKYFQIPNGKAAVDSSSFLVAAIIVLIISLVTYLTCRSELKESPAETLREEMPKVKSKSLNITSKGIFKNMKFASKWNFRDVLRNKTRTLMGLVGIVGCTMILVCAFGMFDTLHNFIDWQFDDLYNFNYKLSLNEGYSSEKFNEITSKYGDATSQTLGIEIKNGDKREANNIFVTDAKDYVRFTSKEKEYITLEDTGIYVTQKLAENKGYKIGDKLTWHIYGSDTYYESEIVGMDRDPQNQNIKMTRKYLELLGLEYKADTVYTNDDLSNIKEIDGVELIQNKSSLEDGMSNMLNTMQSMIILLIVVAAILGSVIIYNLGVLSFTEKQYQFATLKVLGFKDRKIKKIFIKQNNWITIVSIIIGLPLGYLMTSYIFKAALAENYDMHAYIKVFSYIYAAIGTLVVSFVSSHVLAKKVKKIDMVTSLKGNE
ncbi:putative uncharacterized protein [Clostridium sp. CAG:440]|nr:putative uncharacterized protein [Clostridium sp. CAG:440]